MHRFLPKISRFCCRLALLLSPLVAESTTYRCQAQLADGPRASLNATIQSAQTNLDSRRLPVYEVMASDLTRASDRVESYFRPITDSANTEKWMTYLATRPLIELIQADASEEKIIEQAQLARGRMIGNIAGLELTPIVELREQVDEFIASTRFKDPANSVKFINQQLASLENRINDAGDIPSAEEAAAIAAISKVIQESNQTQAVTHSLRGVFSNPNILFAVSSSLIQTASAQAVDRDRQINDCILGTRVVGNGSLRGLVTARTSPSFGSAAIELTLDATFESRNRGYNGPVSLDTSGRGNVMSRRTLYLSQSGVSLSPSTTTASLTSKIHSINHPLKLVRRIATRKAAEQKPKADAIATTKLREQVGKEFDQQIEQAVAGASSSSRQAAFAQGRTTLTRLNLPQPAIAVGSTDHSIYLSATQMANDQLAAINGAPLLIPGSFDLAMQLHESAVDNIASRVIAGRTMTSQQIDRLISSIGRPTPSTNATNADAKVQESFAIDFARFRPIIFEARDQTVKLGLRGTRFKQGERELKRPLEITAIYRPVQTMDGTTYLERVGNVGVDFPGDRRLTIAQVALRRSIQRTFDDRFPTTLLDQRLTLPSTLPVASMRGKTLRATAIDSRDGWISVSAR